MQKVNQNIGKYVALVTALLVVIVAAVFIILMPKRQNPSAIMEMNVNPNVQFLLDQNNKVMQVNYLNDDAQTLLKNTSFKGKRLSKQRSFLLNYQPKLDILKFQHQAQELRFI